MYLSSDFSVNGGRNSSSVNKASSNSHKLKVFNIVAALPYYFILADMLSSCPSNLF